eukprot:TCONS_00072203-protein
MELYWLIFGIVSIFYCVEGSQSDKTKWCTSIVDAGPFVNGTHYCVRCNYVLKAHNRLRFVKSAYGCGCDEWKPLQSDGCCIKTKNADPKNRAIFCAKRPKSINITGPTVPEDYGKKKVIASQKITHENNSTSYDKLPLLGGGFLLLVALILVGRVYMCVRSNRQQRRPTYEFHRVVALDVNSLQEHRV